MSEQLNPQQARDRAFIGTQLCQTLNGTNNVYHQGFLSHAFSRFQFMFKRATDFYSQHYVFWEYAAFFEDSITQDGTTLATIMAESGASINLSDDYQNAWEAAVHYDDPDLMYTFVTSILESNQFREEPIILRATEPTTNNQELVLRLSRAYNDMLVEEISPEVYLDQLEFELGQLLSTGTTPQDLLVRRLLTEGYRYSLDPEKSLEQCIDGMSSSYTTFSWRAFSDFTLELVALQETSAWLQSSDNAIDAYLENFLATLGSEYGAPNAVLFFNTYYNSLDSDELAQAPIYDDGPSIELLECSIDAMIVAIDTLDPNNYPEAILRLSALERIMDMYRTFGDEYQSQADHFAELVYTAANKLGEIPSMLNARV
ncbi:hypothetical protein KC909_00445 [Candidatus Dojkabacteria bacterium]|uniref:DUF4375 domain-containing protein n=1 Tax=Candidatus Dojkabacteria bacterium TaxID=2099670 RepID=A0A955RIK1_9BACT|nr:hypothetical protein [Candidatus Dojkabacteria bacterium]